VISGDSGGAGLAATASAQYVGDSNVSTTQVKAEQIADFALSTGTLYVDLNSEAGFSGTRTVTMQFQVNGTNVGSAITYTVITQSGVQHFAETGLGIAPGDTVDLVVTQNSSSLSTGVVTWTLGP
jgi:hypothetical protein